MSNDTDKSNPTGASPATEPPAAQIAEPPAPQHAEPPAVPPPPAAPTPSIPPSAPSRRTGLGTASLVVGIIAVVFAVIPFVSFAAFLPALAALGLGIAALALRRPGKKRTIAGTALGVIALVLAIIVSSAVVSSIANSLDAVGKTKAGTALTAPSASPSTAPDKAAAKPKASAPKKSAPAPAPVPADVTYKGSGDSVLKIALPDGTGVPGVATITHNGSSNFAVWSLDSNMKQEDLLVNVIGGYQGTVLFDVRSGESTTALQITADGAWTVTLHSLSALHGFTDSKASGHGDDVLVYRGAAGAAAITHDGTSNFAVWSYGDSSDLAVNVIGTYSGTVRWPAGPAIIAISADGNWTISVK